jgi:hypothetical protein
MTSIKLDSDGNILDGNNRRRSTDGWTMEDYKKFFASNAPPARTEVIEMDDELLSKLID